MMHEELGAKHKQTSTTTASRSSSINRVAMGITLASGDTAMFLIFAAVGRMSHQEAAGLTALFEVVKTAAPFIAGWFLTAPCIGGYRLLPLHASENQSPTSHGAPHAHIALDRVIRHTALAWVVAWPAGLLLRALFLWRPIPLTFALVTFITNLVLLIGWRTLFAFWLSRRQA